MFENLKKLWAMIVPASVLVSLVFPIAGLIWYFFSVESRISKLENQVQLMATAPLKWDSTASGEPHAAPQTQINPVLQVCLDLVKKLGEQGRTDSVYIQQYISDYGCKEIMAIRARSRDDYSQS